MTHDEWITGSQARIDAMKESGPVEPKMVAPDHQQKMIYPEGIGRKKIIDWAKEMVNNLAGKGCTFFQLDENDECTVMLVSGWLKRPLLPDVPYVNRDNLDMPQVPAA